MPTASVPLRPRQLVVRAAGTAANTPSSKLHVARRFAVLIGEESAVPGRRVADYCRLPAERYSLLDSRAVSRVPGSPDVFRVSAGQQRLPMFVAEPVGMIRIKVQANGVVQSLERAELLPVDDKPNAVLEEINAVLSSICMQNAVFAQDSPEGVQLVCSLQLDALFTRGVLARVPEQRLNGIMAWALGTALPWFLAKLRTDYQCWSEDRPRDQGVGSGEIAELAKRLVLGGGALPRGVTELTIPDDGLAAAPLFPSATEMGGDSTKARGFGGKAS